MSKPTETINATIKAVSMSTADHGVLSSFLSLDYGGTCQGFGGYALHTKRDGERSFAGLWIWRILEVVGVEEWSKLVGKNIRVRREAGWGGLIEAIGHITKDKWFCPKEEFKDG